MHSIYPLRPQPWMYVQVLNPSDPLGADPGEEWTLREAVLALKQRVQQMQATQTPATRARGGRRKLWDDIGDETAVRALLLDCLCVFICSVKVFLYVCVCACNNRHLAFPCIGISVSVVHGLCLSMIGVPGRNVSSTYHSRL